MVIKATKFRKFRRFIACIADLYIYIYIYIYIYVCMYACIYNLHICTHIYIYICIYYTYLLAYLMYNYSMSPGFSLITQNQSTCRVRSEGRQKACRPTAPKMGPRRSASQRNVSKGAGMPVLFCSKHECQDMRTASGSIQDPGRSPRHPQISKLTYFRTLQSYTRKGSKTSFCESQR